MSNLTEFYDSLEAVSQELTASQPWWPCNSCPVATTFGNCCHKSMFHVTRTEWEYLREHPFIQENRERLIKKARRRVKALQQQGFDTSRWSTVIDAFNKGAVWTCPLLNIQTGRCQVYDRRPTICRTYGISRSDRFNLVYGCQIVTDEVAKRGNVESEDERGTKVNFVPLDQVLDYLADNVAHGDETKPIVAWLAGEKL